MNKGYGGKQPVLRNGWFYQGDHCITQSMNFLNENNQSTQKIIQKILDERELWPAKGLNLSCPKPKCFNCQAAAECKICVRGHKYDTCKVPRQCS